MKKKKAVRKSLSGGPAMLAAGFKPVQIWLTAQERADLEKAAALIQRPMAQTIKLYGLQGVKKILERRSDASDIE